jgi:dTDP-4-amino-4,6-dideoxygalactose transaminase
LAVTDLVGNEILSLPLHSARAPEVQSRVIAGVREFFQ